MPSEKQKASNQECQLELAFITISDQNAIKDPARQQLARTQAIKHSLERKRHQLQLASKNFVNKTPNTVVRRRKRKEKDEEDQAVELPKRSASFQAGVIDPFSTLSIDAGRLAKLLRHNTAQQAGEPVFSVNDAIDYQCLKSVFRAGLEDPALAAALCLTLAFAAKGGILDRECAAYRLQAIQGINSKLSDPAEATSTSTVGAILLLVGVEVCQPICQITSY